MCVSVVYFSRLRSSTEAAMTGASTRGCASIAGDRLATWHAGGTSREAKRGTSKTGTHVNTQRAATVTHCSDVRNDFQFTTSAAIEHHKQ